MKVKVEKTFPFEFPATTAWKLLSDLPLVATCMPGAEIIEKVYDHHYTGKVKVKVGPATMAFKGKIIVKNIDDLKQELQMIGKGQDLKGSSSAEMEMTAWLVPKDGEGCELKGKSTITVNGKLASLGGRMMTQVSDQILAQFGKNFVHQITALGEGKAAESAREKLAEQAKTLNGISFAGSLAAGFIKNLISPKKKD